MRDLILGLVGGMLFGGLVVYVLSQNGIVPSKINSNPQPSTTTVSTNDISAPHIPIPLDDSVVTFAGVTYSLNGDIQTINPRPNNTNEKELILHGTGGAHVFNNLFFITDQTIVNSSASSSAKIKPSELKSGDRVTINYFYDLKVKKGYVTSIQLNK